MTLRPKVQRWVRLAGTITPDALAFGITPHLLAQQDALTYLDTETNLRYQEIRIIRCRAWMETPIPTFTQPSIGLILQDAATGTDFESRPVSGSTYAAAGMQLALETRNEVFATTDTSLIIAARTDIGGGLPVGAQIAVIVDVMCEFG